MNAAVELLALADAVALIDEERCIGCTLCINACPVDAIVGASKCMHTVVAAWCTGCALCVPPCPVDCIELKALPARDAHARDAAQAQAQRRHALRNARLERVRLEKAAKAAAQREAGAMRRKRETIARAMALARARLAARKP